MRERDEEGRPTATRNAGAFLAPYTGVVPVPSSLVEDRSAHSADESQIERHGSQAKTTTATSSTGRRQWGASVVTSVSVWVLLATAFRLVLLASEPWAETDPVVIGDQMTVLMHAGWFWWVANAAFIAISVKLGLDRAPAGGRWRLAIMAATTVACAAVITLAIEAFGANAAAFVAGGAIVWLITARWLRS